MTLHACLYFTWLIPIDNVLCFRNTKVLYFTAIMIYILNRWSQICRGYRWPEVRDQFGLEQHRLYGRLTS